MSIRHPRSGDAEGLGAEFERELARAMGAEDNVEELARLVARLQEEVARLRELLATCQWADTINYGTTSACPECRNSYRQGHAESCDIGRALRPEDIAREAQSG